MIGCCDLFDYPRRPVQPRAGAKPSTITAASPRSTPTAAGRGSTSASSALQASDFNTGIGASAAPSPSATASQPPPTTRLRLRPARRQGPGLRLGSTGPARPASSCRSYLTRDEDLESLRDDPRYEKLKKKVKADRVRLFSKHGKVDFDFDFDFDIDDDDN